MFSFLGLFRKESEPDNRPLSKNIHNEWVIVYRCPECNEPHEDERKLCKKCGYQYMDSVTGKSELKSSEAVFLPFGGWNQKNPKYIPRDEVLLNLAKYPLGHHEAEEE